MVGYILLAASLAFFTIYLCYALEWRGPFRDLWEFVGLLQQQLNGQWSPGALLEPYGGIHRIALPKLLFYLDYRYASGSNLLALTATLALHILGSILFIRSIIKSEILNTNDKWLLTATVVLFFASTTQIYNLIYISDNQVPISNTFALFALFAFSIYLSANENSKIRWLYVGNLFVLIACLSHSSSLMAWPAMIIMMLLHRKPFRHTAMQAVFSIIILLLYVSGYDPLDTAAGESMTLLEKASGAIGNLLMNMQGILRYIGLYLASPASREWPLAGITLGYISISYVASLGWRMYQKRWVPTQVETFWMCVAIYIICVAIITACGRQVYPNSALTDRYQTLVMTYWVALLLLLYTDLKQRKLVPELLVPLCTLLLLLPHQQKNAEEMAWLDSRVTIAHTAATVGITNIDVIAATLSHPLLIDNKNLVDKHNNFLRQERLGYFSDESAFYFLAGTPKPFGDPVNRNQHCGGKLTSIEILSDHPAQYRLRGDAQLENGDLPSHILVLDKQEMVIGLGKPHREKNRWRAHEWIGFINADAPLQLPLIMIGKQDSTYCFLFEINSLTP